MMNDRRRPRAVWWQARSRAAITPSHYRQVGVKRGGKEDTSQSPEASADLLDFPKPDTDSAFYIQRSAFR